MSRLVLPTILVLFGAAATKAATTEKTPHLRVPRFDDILETNPVYTEPKETEPKELESGGAKFAVEKGMKCEGDWKMGSGGGKKCAGEMKSEFDVSFSAQDIAKELADQVLEETTAFMPGIEAYYPDESIMAEFVALDEEGLFDDDMEEGLSKTIELGGFVKVDFGCNVTYTKEKGKLTKKSACGFRGVSGAGKKG